MEETAFPIVITGHIDHGKSTLIGRLLYDTGVLKEDRYQEVEASSSLLGKETEFAFVLDALEEERSRGITIDTTQIYFQTPKRKYVIIDAPGHKEFLRNMVTGASYAEAAVLIIDAKEGVMEQTKRHAYLLSMVGVKDICVVINKMDLMGYSKDVFEAVRDEITAFFAPLSIVPRLFIPIAALKGVNVAKKDPELAWYDGPTLLEALDQVEFKSLEERPFRFPVQDVYDIDGEKILAGRIESGWVEPGMTVHILPRGTKCEVKEIRKFLAKDIRRAAYGESIGLVLANGVSADRGDVVSGETVGKTTNSFDAHVFWFYGEYNGTEKIMIRCTTQESPCRVRLYEKFDPATMDKKEGTQHLEIGEVARVRVETERPIVIDPFSYIPETGRFVIEQNGIPVGGGTVV